LTGALAAILHNKEKSVFLEGLLKCDLKSFGSMLADVQYANIVTAEWRNRHG